MDQPKFFEANKDVGVLVLRLLFGYRLVEGMCIVLFTGQLQGLSRFFADNHIPFTPLSAYLAVFAELICGLLYIIGWQTRLAALVMIFTFAVAIAFVDIHVGFEQAFPAWSILAVSIFLWFYGAGKISVDGRLSAKV